MIDLHPRKDETIWDRWSSNADRSPDLEIIVHCVAGEDSVRWTWAALMERAAVLADRLLDFGIQRGDVCALIVRHHPEFYPLYLAVESLGAIPAVIAYPNARLHPDKFRQGLSGMSRASGLDWILTERDIESLIAPVATGTGSTIRAMLFPLEWTEDATATGSGRLTSRTDSIADGVTAHGADAPCLLQHSSGTTGLQKAVMLSHRAVLDHVGNYGRAIGLSPDDRVVSWLPLYHDMGLIAAFHLPLAANIPVVMLDPFEWISAPVLLLDAISRESGTLSWLPNFAYNLMATRVHDDDMEGASLKSMRAFINCSEPVRSSSHDLFAARFEPFGLQRSALAACYAMAETTFAVSQTPVGTEARVFAASRDDLARGIAVPARQGEEARACVSSGAPIPGCHVRITGADAGDLSEGEVGEIQIQSASMFGGYRNSPEQTARALRDGWYASGDNGFMLDGEVYVIGRQKDLIILAGKNIFPEDVEHAVYEVDGVIPGRVIAFGIDDEATGTQRVCVVAETAASAEDVLRRMRTAVVQAGMRIDVTISDVHFVEPRWMIKSSAGKPSRSANRERILDMTRTTPAGSDV